MISTRDLRGHAAVIGVLCGVLVAALQSCSGTGSLAPLRCAHVPAAVSGDILDRAAAIQLGKALFRDTQIGGDGQVACATGHVHGGADPTTTNSVNPGLDGSLALPMI